MKTKIFVDGQEGTTGLRINEYLSIRSDIQLLTIDPALRKDVAERKRLLNAADVAILCLPDVASREAVGLIDNSTTKVIDASTAFRTDPTWAYGLPELLKGGAQREKIRHAKRVAVPGCHASAFLLAVRPLIDTGILSSDVPLTCFSLTGYSGGGKKMIAAYEDPTLDNDPAARQKMRAPRHYALTMDHKHLPEMRVMANLDHAPAFTPVVCPVHSGLTVEVFLPPQLLARRIAPVELQEILAEQYAGEQFVSVLPFANESNLNAGFFDLTACNGTNRVDLAVFGREEQFVILSRLDNLGKGAAGAAVQCLNLMIGADESLGLASHKNS